MADTLRNAGFSSSTARLHKVYAYLTGLLITLVAIKYQNSGTSPFHEHEVIMLFFLTAIFVYATSLIHVAYFDHSPRLSFYVCHVSGAVACELLVLVLTTPIWWVVINVSSAILVVALCFCYLHAPVFFSFMGRCFRQTPVGTNSSSTDVQEEPVGVVVEMMDAAEPAA